MPKFPEKARMERPSGTHYTVMFRAALPPRKVGVICNFATMHTSPNKMLKFDLACPPHRISLKKQNARIPIPKCIRIRKDRESS